MSDWAGNWLSSFFGDPHALLVLVVAGFLPNEVWRMLGLWLGGGVDEGSEVLIWVRAVATAILAGVIAQILGSRPARWPAYPTGCATARSRQALRRSCGRGARSSPAWSAARSRWWPENGGSVDCSRGIIR